MKINSLKNTSVNLSQNMSPDSSKNASKDFSFPIRVYWEDTDAGSIVYYANYLKFFERARSEWLRLLGVEQGKLLIDHGCMFVVSEIQTKFLFPARIDDLLAVTVSIQKIGHASIYLHQTALIQTEHAHAHAHAQAHTHAHAISQAPVAKIACEGSVRLACVQQNTMRPTVIPKSIIALINRT